MLMSEREYVGFRTAAKIIKAGDSTIIRALREFPFEPPIETQGNLIAVSDLPRLKDGIEEYKRNFRKSY